MEEDIAFSVVSAPEGWAAIEDMAQEAEETAEAALAEETVTAVRRREKAQQARRPSEPRTEAVRQAEPRPEETYTPPWAGQAQPGKPVTGVVLLAEGRSTLPVDLIPTAGAGRRASFSGLGTADLSVGLSRTIWMSSYWVVGFILIAVVGVAKIAAPPRTKAKMIVAVLAATSLIAVWRPALVYFANGAFMAALCLVPLYLLAGLLRLLRSKSRLPDAPDSASATAAVILICVISLGCSVQAAVPSPPKSAPVENAPPPQPVEPKPQPIQPIKSDSLIIPYDADPTAVEDADKVLISYARFIKLWNQAHPEDAIEQPKPAMDISLADVRYDVTIEGETLNLLLTADIATYGRDWAVLPMPMSGLAVVKATIDGRPAQFHSPPQNQGKKAAAGSMVLMVPGRTSGQLTLEAVTKPNYFGPRGNAKFTLPPLPAPVMRVVLPDKDLELEVDKIDNVPKPEKTDGIVKWTIPLGMTRDIELRWMPKAGGGTADRTLSADSSHDVYAFHWALVGITKIAYSFSAGEHDRFACLLPKAATLTEVKGTNIRDYRNLGEKTVEGKTFNIIEVRLHRPAKKKYDLTVRWLSALPEPGEPVRLLLVRAADITRESGSVTLHAAGGMEVKVAKVAGGRRTAIGAQQDKPAAELTADEAKPLARYYWPYRPFALSVQFSRLVLAPKVRLDQLVRIDTDRTELLTQAVLEAEEGKIFGAGFILPQEYELLSVVGPAVENFYERAEDNQNFLHVQFDRGRKDAKIAIVMIRRETRPEAFEVPLIRYVDSGAPVPKQQGRLAVQVAASLEAKTLRSNDLKSIVPQSLRDWLDSNQMNSVQFAYSYELADPSLQLEIRPEPTRVRVEAFAGLAVKTTAAAYTYRLRYDISGSPVDNISFSLPTRYAPLAAVSSPALRSVTRDDDPNGRTTWNVVLVNEVTGVVDIAVNFALPIEASTKTLLVPVIETEAPAGYRAVVAVQNLSRHDISIKEENKKNLAELAVSEQRKLRMSREMTESLQYVFQSFEKDWALAVDFSPAKMAARIQAVVDLLELTTVIDRNGRTRYRAKLALQNRSEQFLRIELPEGLRLWSATVASQPVKPVTDGDDVLIPLVKTSPGGLPYDVYLYFADDSDRARPLVSPLNGITNLKPPAVTVADIPVMQTTWSLRLPAGYRYMRPGGNMSPVAGTVEMLSLNIDAKLKQLERLDKTYRDVSGSNTRSEAVAGQNWKRFNTSIIADIEEAKAFLESNKRDVSEQDYERLNTKLGGQEAFQNTLFVGNSAFISEQQQQLSNDLNVWINADVSNPGIAEVDRNVILQQKPRFIIDNEEKQIARLQKELEVSQKQLKDLQQQIDKAESGDAIVAAKEESKRRTLKPPIRPQLGKEAADLLYSRTDKKAETQGILDELSKKSAEQIDRKQMMIRNQLSELTDNRLRRHYELQAQQQQQVAQMLQPQGQQQIRLQSQNGAVDRDFINVDAGAIQVDNFDINQRRTQRGYAGGGYGGMGGMGRQGGAREAYNYGMPQTPGGEVRAGEVTRDAQPPSAVTPPGAVTGPATTGGRVSFDIAGEQQYVAKGTYSLPVILPEGEVRLDFACPAGKAQLDIWAVPQTTITNLCATAAVIATLLILLAIIKLWPANAAPISLKRAIIYVILFAIFTAILGLLGLAIILAITLAAEAIRASARQKPTPDQTA
jgi:hypothetical protein